MGLEIIEDETDRLSNMVEELLDFSKIINGIVKLNKDNCDLEVFIEYIETLMKARAIKEDKTFIVKGEKNIGNAYFDVNKIKQVLINIIDNAFKFTNRGGQISLQCYKEKGNIVFLVKDNGVGISLEDLPKVKNKFYIGRWRIVGKLGATETFNKDFIFSILPNKKLINFNMLYVPWKTLKGELVFFKDAFTSPEAQIMLVQFNNYLSVYKINNGMIEESPLANIPIYPDEEIIMTEWCGSSYVDQWERIFLNGEIIE